MQQKKKNQGTYLQELQWFSAEQYICLELF